MKCKRFLALLLTAASVFLASCGALSEETTTEQTTTAETTTAETTTAFGTEATTIPEEVRIPVEEIAAAVRIAADPVEQTKEIPLIIILANFDADGDGEDDWDENDPTKLYADPSAPYYGEQWAGTEVTDHYELYFGDGYSLTNYYEELTMGAFRFVPLKFDVVPEGSPYTDGIIEVVVNMPHPSASGDAQGAITAVFEATDPYVDYFNYDTNGNGKIDATELGVVILNPGMDKAYGTSDMGGKQKFQVHGTSQGLAAYVDFMSFSKVSNFGEYGKNGTIMQIGTPAHELAHNLGAEDLYDTKRNGHGGNAVTGWPRAYDFSLESNGNHRGGGAYPTYLDPYHRIYLKWADYEVVGDGVYTIYSTLTDQYKILRVNSPDPNEYFLIEIRLKEGFEKKLTDGDSLGGIMIWHIDDDLNQKYFVEGSASTSTSLNGVRHDPAIVPLFREGYDEEGRMMADTTPNDPFYYYSEDSSTAIFDSGNFRSATNGTQSLNSYPEDWEGKENWNLHVEVLSEPGQEMTVKITTGRKDFLPKISADYETKTSTSITVKGKVLSTGGSEITAYGIAFSSKEDFSDDVTIREVTADENGVFLSVFEGLSPSTEYYYKVFVKSDSGYVEASASTKTSDPPKPVTKLKIKLHGVRPTSKKTMEVSVTFGETMDYQISAVSGYVFEGWFYDEAFTQPYDTATIITSDMEAFDLYGKWSAVQ